MAPTCSVSVGDAERKWSYVSCYRGKRVVSIFPRKKMPVLSCDWFPETKLIHLAPESQNSRWLRILDSPYKQASTSCLRHSLSSSNIGRLPSCDFWYQYIKHCISLDEQGIIFCQQITIISEVNRPIRLLPLGCSLDLGSHPRRSGQWSRWP